ncbi:MAG: peptide chain release factor N(5)-glutamine methyltransferase [Saprospiraceae bacterium]
MTLNDAFVALVDIASRYESDSSARTIAKYILEDVFPEYTKLNKGDFDIEDSIKFRHILDRLRYQEPYQYITNRADFYGKSFFVDNRVLIPRPETEELAHKAISLIRKHHLTSCLDIGTGSGVLPITIALETGIKNVSGLDISEGALEVAKMNASKHLVEINWHHIDVLDFEQLSNVPNAQLIISNPPYITKDEQAGMAANVLDHEPHNALFVKHNALEFYSAISTWVTRLKQKTYVVFEISEFRAKEVVQLLSNLHFHEIELLEDMQRKQRIVTACFIE